MTLGSLLVAALARGVRASVILAAGIGVFVYDRVQQRKQEALALDRWADDGGPTP